MDLEHSGSGPGSGGWSTEGLGGALRAQAAGRGHIMEGGVRDSMMALNFPQISGEAVKSAG